MINSSRDRRVPRLVSALVASMLAMTVLGTTQSAAVGNQETASSAVGAKKLVLQSEYGKARSNVRGTFGKHGVVTGTFTPRRFVVRHGQLMAIGTLKATLSKDNGTQVGKATKRVVLPVRKAEGMRVSARAATSCNVLNLVLGPLDLNLLGLEVHLSRVLLDIVAVTGAGNLLGNLLCAVAGLLDQNGVLTQISQILNSILSILRL